MILVDPPPHGEMYGDTASMILALSGLSQSALIDASIELQADYEFFLVDYRGTYLTDAYMGFAEMFRHWNIPWPGSEGSALNGLTLAQFYLALAWEQNDIAKYLLNEKAIVQGWEPREAMRAGVSASLSAAKLLRHAKLLIATDDPLAQQMAEQPS